MFENGLVGTTCLQEAGVRMPLLAASAVEDKENMILLSRHGRVVAPESDPIEADPRLAPQDHQRDQGP